MGGSLARNGEAPDPASKKEAIWSALREVRDEMFYTVDANVVDMGYIYDVKVRSGIATILMTMPHRGRPKYNFIGHSIRERLLKIGGLNDVIIECTWEPPWDVARLEAAGRAAMGLA